MSFYFFLRYGLISLLLIGWVLYQFIIKRKKWAAMANDVIAVAFFVVVWIALAYIFTN